MKPTNPLFCLLALCAALAAPPVPGQSKEAAVAAQRLVVSSGLSVQLGSFAKQFAVQFGQQRGKISDALIVELTNAAQEAFRADILQGDIADGIARKLKVEEINGAIAWLETPVGKRVTAAEERASAMEEAAVRKYSESLKDKKPTAARTRLIRDIIAATPAEEGMAQKVQAMALGVAMGMDSTHPVQQRIGLERLQARVKAAMPIEKLKEQMRVVLPAIMSYTYRDVSDADLAAYVAFLRSPVGKRYQDQVTDAYTEAIIHASVRLGQLVDIKTSKQPA